MNPLLIHTLLKKWVLLLSVPLSLMLLPASRASDFRQPENITGDDITIGAPHMSQDSAGQLLWDDGRLVLAYWEGDGSVSPATPSHIMRRYWNPADGWSAAERLDHGQTGDGTDIGGRHPAMIRRADGSIFTVWHDMRNCTAAHTWIDNVEIYGNQQPADGSPSTEQRLTQTLSDSNFGNNGYLPRLAPLSDGRLVLVWYDFAYTTGELFMNISDAQGNFTTASDLAPLRLTGASDRPAGAENENFAVPSVAVDGDDIIHLAWTSVDSGTGATPTYKLYYGRYDPAQGQWLEIGLYRTQTGGYYDPARLIADPTTGGIWLLYVDRATSNDQIYAEYRAAGATAFEDRVHLSPNGARRHYPDGLVDANGVLDVVYVDEADDSIQLVTYDRATQTLSAPVALTTENLGNLYRPALTQDERGSLYVVFENKIGISDVNLWFTTNRPPENAAQDWMLYR